MNKIFEKFPPLLVIWTVLPVLGTFTQFLIMPLAAFCIAKTLPLEFRLEPGGNKPVSKEQ